MKSALSVPILVAILAVVSADRASAGFCGVARFLNCNRFCDPCDYCSAKQQCHTVMKTCKEMVYEKQNYTCYKTVYETVYED